MKQKLLLVTAVFFGLIAFVLTYQQIEYERRKALGAAVTKDFIRLRKQLTRGDTIKSQDIQRYKEKRFKRTSYREIPWSKRNSIIGREVDVTLPAKHLLEWGDLKAVAIERGGLTSKIPMEHRAISIPVDTISSVSSLIRPGNHVDIIGTFRFPEMKGDRALDTITLTILQDVTVLATGTQMVGQATAENARIRRSYSTITLSLTPKEVEMIVFAMQKGKLTLSLRNPEETKIETEDLQSINFRFFEKNLPNYNKDRARRRHYISD